MRLHVIGNSHTTALARGRRRLGADLVTRFEEVEATFVAPARFERVPFSRLEGDTVHLRLHELARHLAAPSAPETIAGEDVWGICMGLHNITIVRERFWNTHEPARIAVPPAAPVSPALMEEVNAAAQRHVHDFLLHLKGAGVRSFVVSSPPLRRDHVAVEGRRHEVSLEVDRLAREAMRRFTRDHGIGYVDHPPEAVADDGFLLEEWHAPDRKEGVPDMHHANPDYGALMVRRVVDFAEDRFAPGEDGP